MNETALEGDDLIKTTAMTNLRSRGLNYLTKKSLCKNQGVIELQKGSTSDYKTDTLTSLVKIVAERRRRKKNGPCSRPKIDRKKRCSHETADDSVESIVAA